MTRKRKSVVFERTYAELPGFKNVPRDVPVKTIEYTNSLAYGETAEDPLVVVFAMGRLASRRSHKRLLHETVREATAHERGIRLITYEEPRRPNGYAPEQMASRLGKVVLDARLYHRPETPVHLVGHSAAASGVVHAADQLIGELPNLGSVTAYTPSGDRATARHRDFLDFFGIAVEETRFIRHAFGGGIRGVWGGLAASFHLATEAAVRASLAPRTFFRAVTTSFYHDRHLTERVHNLNGAGVITNAVIAQYDGANHYGSGARELTQNGFQNVIVLQDTSHLGAVTKASSGAELFHAINDADNLYRSQQAGTASLPGLPQ